MSAIEGGITRNPITGKEPLQLTEEDMKAIKRLQASGVGQRELDAGAVGAIIAHQRRAGVQSKGERYRQWRENLAAAMTSMHPKAVAAFTAANESMRQKFLSSDDVHTDQVMSNMSVMYGNDEYIGEELMPVVGVPLRSGNYATYEKRDRMAVPDGNVGDYGEAAELSKSRSQGTYACEDKAWKDAIAATALANQDAPLNEMIDLQEGPLEIGALNREISIAAVAGVSTSYGSNTQALAAANRWDVPGGDPIGIVQTADAALWTGRGPSEKRCFSSLDVYNVLSRHQDILSLFIYAGTSPGLATPDMIARYFGCARYLVGRARKDTANEGQTASYSRIWPDVFGIVRVSMNPGLRNAVFGSTFRWTLPGVPGSNGGIVTKQWYDQKRGLGGSYWAEVGYSEDYVVVASDTGYLLTTVIN